MMTSYDDDKVFLPNPRVAYRKIGERFVLVQIETQAMLKLNEVGTAIWGWLDGRSVGAIVRAVAEQFAVTEHEAHRDALDFLAQLHARGLVESGR